MKQTLSEIMISMKPMVWIGAAALAIGLVALVLRFAKGHNDKLTTTLSWTSALLLGLGLFFVAAQFMGQWLGMQPQINFGDPTKFEFKLVMFWQLGVVSLIGGIIYRLVGKPA